MNPLYEVMLSNRMRGIFHAGGPRRLNLYQIGQIINRVGGYDPELPARHSPPPSGPDPAAGRQRRMDSSKLVAALGYNPFAPWPLDDALAPTDRDWHFRRSADDPGSAERLYRLLCTNPARRNGQPPPLRAGSVTPRPGRP